MQTTLFDNNLTNFRRRVVATLHVGVLIASFVMIIWITRETIENISFISAPGYLRFQFWICLLLMADVIVEWIVSPRKLRYILSNLFFIIISIPWLNIVDYFHFNLYHHFYFLVRFMPLIRAGYLLMLISGAISSNKALTMMAVYIIWGVVSVYYGSLVFFVEEYQINTDVTSWYDSLWWATLCLTTVGSAISPITETGKMLAMILSAEGLILFPVFTVYATNAVLASKRQLNQISEGISNQSQFNDESAKLPHGLS